MRLDMDTQTAWHEIEDNAVMYVSENMREAKRIAQNEYEVAIREADAHRIIAMQNIITELDNAMRTLKNSLC